MYADLICTRRTEVERLFSIDLRLKKKELTGVKKSCQNTIRDSRNIADPDKLLVHI